MSNLLKASIGCGSVFAYIMSQKVQAKDCHECHMKRLPKANELPLYDENNFVAEHHEQSMPFMNEISVVRKQLCLAASYTKAFQEQAIHVYETGVAHTKSTFDYLKSEENTVQRALIISSGGLFGLLLARRGNILKKAFSTSLGAGAVFTIFYPHITVEYSQTGWKATKEQLSGLLSKYGGYDMNKVSDELDKKVEMIKSSIKLDTITSKISENFPISKSTENKKGE